MMKILTPHDIENEMTNYIVLGLAFIFESVTWWMAFKEFQSCRRQLGTIAAVRDSKAPAMITELLEDTAAKMGLLVGFLIICLGQTLHMLVLNGAASVVIGITLANVSLFLAIECKGLLVGESAKSLVVRGIRALEDARDGIFGVNELWTMHLGPEDLLVNISVDLADRLTSSDVEAEISELE